MSNLNSGCPVVFNYGASLSTSPEGWPDLSVESSCQHAGVVGRVEAGILSDEEVASLPSCNNNLFQS